MPTTDHLSLPTSSGVYAISLVKSGRVVRRYVGSGKNMRKRVNEHVGLLRRGLHPTPRLQNAWSCHGEASFVYEVLETCLNAPLILIAREDHWIASYKGRIFNSRSAAEQFSSEWHRTEEAKAVHAEHARKMERWWKSREATERTCRQCGESFLSRHTSDRVWYCSVRCRRVAYRGAGLKGLTRTPVFCDRPCVHCGGTFRARKDSKSRFCSALCQNHAASKLTEADIIPIIRRVLDGERPVTVAKSLGVGKTVVFKILARETWLNVNLPPELEAAMEEYRSGDARAARQSKVDLSPEAVADILERLAAKESQHSIARRHGVSQSTISDINTGKTKWWSEGFGLGPIAPAALPLFPSEPTRGDDR